jgi:hypothetical protein
MRRDRIRPDHTRGASNVSTRGRRKLNVFIVGARRSGTTILWETFRQDSRFTCFDEPFAPHLRRHVHLREDNHKGTFAEYIARPELVSALWSTIQPYEELLPGLLGHQHSYVQALTSVNGRVCIDFVRAHARIADLRRADPTALIVHLVRDPRSVVTSHLKPYDRWTSPRLPADFFDYEGWYDYWQYQTLAGALGYRGRAIVGLLLVWRALTATAESENPDVTLRYEDFARDPEETMRELYALIDLEYRGIDASRIHPPKPPHAATDPRWRQALTEAGIAGTELARFVSSPARSAESTIPSLR